MDWRARASMLGIGSPPLREQEVAIADADRDEPFVYRAAAGFIVWAAVNGAQQSMSFDRLSNWQTGYGFVASSLALAAGILWMSFPHWLGRMVRQHALIVMLAAIVSAPVLVIPAGGQFSPVRPVIMILTGLACAYPPRNVAILLACLVATVELACVLLVNPVHELQAANQLGYELIVIPGAIVVAGLLGSIIGEASSVSRSLGEALRRETRRRQRLEQHVVALREAVQSLLAVLPDVLRHITDVPVDRRQSVLTALARTERRAGDVIRSSITVEKSAPTTFAEDVEWLVQYQRATDPTISVETRMQPACATLHLDDGARASLRVAIGRALDNACEHVAALGRVVIEIAVGGDVLTVAVTNSSSAPASIEWGLGLRASQRELRRYGGDLTVHGDEQASTVRWRATLPLDAVRTTASEKPRGTSAAGSIAERVRELLSAVLRVWRVATVAMVLATTFLDGGLITAHRTMSQVVIVVALMATEAIAFAARRGGREREGTIVRAVIAVGLCAYVTHGERSPLTGWALIVTCEVLWHLGWRAYGISVFLTIAALFISMAVPADQDASRAFWAEVLLPLWATPIAAIIVYYLARTARREHDIGTAAQAAWTLTELAIRSANAHALVQLLRLAVAANFAPDHPVRQAVLVRAEHVVELCAAAPGGARSRDSMLRELAEIVAHRISPARCVIRDYTALPLETAARPGARTSAAAREASALSLFAAAADEIASRAPTDLRGRARLEQVLVSLQDIDSQFIEIAINSVPGSTITFPGNTLLTHVALVGGQLVSSRADANLVMTVPTTLLNS